MMQTSLVPFNFWTLNLRNTLQDLVLLFYPNFFNTIHEQNFWKGYIFAA